MINKKKKKEGSKKILFNKMWCQMLLVRFKNEKAERVIRLAVDICLSYIKCQEEMVVALPIPMYVTCKHVGIDMRSTLWFFPPKACERIKAIRKEAFITIPAVLF